MGRPVAEWRFRPPARRPANAGLTEPEVRRILYAYAWSEPPVSTNKLAEILDRSSSTIWRVIVRDTFADVEVDGATLARIEERRAMIYKYREDRKERSVVRPDPLEIPTHEDADEALGTYYETEFGIPRTGRPGNAIGVATWLADSIGVDRRTVVRAVRDADSPLSKMIRVAAVALQEAQRARLRGRDRRVPEDGPRSGFARFARE